MRREAGRRSVIKGSNVSDDAVSKVDIAVCTDGCSRAADVAAYLDGELDAAASLSFERHLDECRACAGLLTEQKRLLCLFDAAFDQTFERKLDLPKNFTRVVTARAQTDMSGVRHGTEHGRALALGATLGVASFALLGATVFGEAFAPVLRVGRILVWVAAILWHALADLGVGAAVILRTVGHFLIAEPVALRWLTWLLFAVAIGLLLRLIGSYHRRGAN